VASRFVNFSQFLWDGSEIYSVFISGYFPITMM
jgi:hypothetical protein